MPATLQIFNYNGGYQAYPLEPQTLLRLGRDPGNDVVLDDPAIAAFHVVLDSRHSPYRLVLLSYKGSPTLDDELLPVNVAVPLAEKAVVRVAHYELKLCLAPAVVPATRPEQPVPPTPRLNGGPGPTLLDLPSEPPEFQPDPTLPPARFDLRPPDQTSDALLVELTGFSDDSRTMPVTPAEEAGFSLTVTNAGRQFARVEIHQSGLPPAWCQLPPVTNIRPQETVILSAAITPPKQPDSRAGTYHFALHVTSGHYPDQPAQLGATVIVAPYYDFAVGELSPKRRTISWFRPYAGLRLTVVNQGNSPASFQLEGQDDERACRFEFHDLPGEPVALTGQAPLHLPPADPAKPEPVHRANLPVRVVPHARPLLLRSRVHHFTISVIPLEGQQTLRRLAGELKQKPLFGLLPMLLASLFLLLLCSSGILLTFRPHIHTFTVNGGVGRVQVKAREPVLLEWQASPFASLRLEPEVGRLETAQGRTVVTPTQSTTYELQAENFLSRLLPFLSERVDRMVEVNPIRPTILTFEASRQHVITGDKLTLAWAVTEADELILTTNGAPEVIPPADYTGRRAVSPNENTVYVLEARNRYGTDSNHLRVAVVTPTGTPVPTPAVEFFTALPNRVVAGEPVTLNWSVSGADSVEISPIGPVPPAGPIAHSPQQTTLYTLLAVKPGAASVHRVQEVVVDLPTGTPTVTATPAPPVIEFFTASATTFILGGEDADNSVTLSWSVTGPTTDVQLFNTDLGLIKGLPPVENNFVVLVNENRTTFVLTAANGEQSASQNLQLIVQTATPEPTATPPPTATATPLPAPRIVFFKAENGLNTPVDHVILIPGTNQYRVVAGANLKLSWSVQDAAQVMLLAGGQSLGAQPFEGNTTLSTVIESKSYELKGLNAQQKSASDFIQIQIEPNTAPSPFDFAEVGLSFGHPTYQFTWAYLNESDILGFRIYRAAGGSFDYQRLVDLPPPTRTWTDPVPPTSCDRFYIVATYLDLISGKIEETDAGSPSWNSPGC